MSITALQSSETIIFMSQCKGKVGDGYPGALFLVERL